MTSVPLLCSCLFNSTSTMQAVHRHLRGWRHNHPAAARQQPRHDQGCAQGRPAAGGGIECCSHLCEYMIAAAGGDGDGDGDAQGAMV